MITRASKSGLALCLAFASTGFLSSACGQTPEGAQSGDPDWQHPITEWGHPDIQGNWTNATLTTFERRLGLGPVYTQEQVDELEGGQRSQVETGSDPSDPERAPPPVTGAIGRSYNQIYYDRGDRLARIDGEPMTSLITFPANGRIPELTPEGARRKREYHDFRSRFGAFDHPELRPLADVAAAPGMAVHMDGARIFNASVALGVAPAELAAVADSVTFCLSKGLSCPVGSVVVGSADFVARARRVRKMAGGGMRQAGIIAAAGLVALDSMVERLAEDHTNAQRLARGLAGLPGIALDPDDVETNICYVELADEGGSELAAALKERGVLANGRHNWVRFVTHHGITSEDVDEALDAIASVVGDKAVVR